MTTKTCPPECIGWTEEQLEQSALVSHYAARASAGEELAAIFAKKAGDNYARGNNDAEAERLREDGKFCASWAKKERVRQKNTADEYQKNFPENG
jgi:hypothetical protein